MRCETQNPHTIHFLEILNYCLKKYISLHSVTLTNEYWLGVIISQVSVEDALSESDNLSVAEAAYRSQDSEDDKHAEASDIVLSLLGRRN